MPKQLPWGESLRKVHSRVASCQKRDNVSQADARLAVATEYGFASWRQIEAHVTHPGDHSDFLLLSCLTYFQTDRPENVERARAMLADDPGLASRDIWHAACVGDVATVARLLDAEPALVNRRGGYFDWEPLLYACYSRLNLPNRSTLGVAGLLIERGADPDSHYMWSGQYRFTALTGAFGEGEMGPVNQPAHEQCVALAGLLLDAGADPNDSQALYNTMFTPGHECLAMLLDHGLTHEHRNNWRWAAEDGVYNDNPDRTLDYQLNWAVQKHHVDRAKLLLDHGADATGRTPDGKTLFEAAVRAGHPDLARYLAERGAEAAELDVSARLIGACQAGDADTARQLVHDNPGLIERVQQAEPDLVVDAAGGNRVEAVRLMAELGFDLGRVADVAPLHQAAFQGHRAMVELLLGKGASLSVRDNHHAATPLQWALTAGSSDVADYLKNLPIGVFDAVVAEDLDRLGSLLDDDPSLLESTIGAERGGDEAHEADWQTPLAFAVLRRRVAAARLLLDRGARVDVADSEGRSLIDIARDDSTAEIVELLSRPSR
ncbi:MAG: ankyrin repeat domain-containing protein [Gammaproteobacteria bacterium]|nr:ankyrin repeat domain-containing protein [Gammaproteobacteria bacterium]MYF27338.1 ankyrin repeat domain-containing protein [Gammaproteobacteria bacterium]MYK47941.1 ankyrin repeat domain-containing protein [Gammaproteobacteria bacterium]